MHPISTKSPHSRREDEREEAGARPHTPASSEKLMSAPASVNAPSRSSEGAVLPAHAIARAVMLSVDDLTRVSCCSQLLADEREQDALCAVCTKLHCCVCLCRCK